MNPIEFLIYAVGFAGIVLTVVGLTITIVNILGGGIYKLCLLLKRTYAKVFLKAG